MTKEGYGKADFETIRRAFAVFNGFDGPDSDLLWWRTDGEYAPVTLMVNCNDAFWWATSDCEVLHPGNIDLLEQTLADVKALTDDGMAGFYVGELFVARVRQMRPQRASYRGYPEIMHPLFNACGPERDQ